NRENFSRETQRSRRGSADCDGAATRWGKLGANRRQLVVAEFARARARTVDALNVLVPPIGSAERRPTNESFASPIGRARLRRATKPIPPKRRRVLGRRGTGQHSRKSHLPVERHQEWLALLISRRRNPVV